MIVSFETIECGRQIYFFNKRLLLKYNYLFFKKAVIVEETFWNCYVNVAKKSFNFVILQYIQRILI